MSESRLSESRLSESRQPASVGKSLSESRLSESRQPELRDYSDIPKPSTMLRAYATTQPMCTARYGLPHHTEGRRSARNLPFREGAPKKIAQFRLTHFVDGPILWTTHFVDPFCGPILCRPILWPPHKPFGEGISVNAGRQGGMHLAPATRRWKKRKNQQI